MAKPQRDFSGILFVNDKKTSEGHPDRKGSATIDGVEYWVSGWIKKGERGQFLSLAFKAKDEAKPTKAEPKGGIEGMDDDIPF